MKNRFRVREGLSAYAFACGYIQEAKYKGADREIEVKMWHEGACFHVRAHEFDARDEAARGRLFWHTEFHLSDARTAWRNSLKELFGEKVAAVKKDRRYTVTLEWFGESMPGYVARFCGEWIDHASTKEAAWVLCAAYEDRRMV